ncbi:MAG: RNA polymerase sigma factor [Verrucomicrobiales bacterium]
MDDENSRLKTLIQRVISRDQDAAKEFIDLLYPQVARIVRSNLPSATDVEDLTQEVFMKVFAKIDQCREVQEVSHWVARIAVNTCYDRLRAQRVRRELRYSDLSLAQVEFLENTLIDTSTTMESPAGGTRGIAKELIDQLIATLKPNEQLVIRMLDLEQQSVAEISEITGWGASKIKVTAMRARQKLRKQLKLLEGTHW